LAAEKKQAIVSLLSAKWDRKDIMDEILITAREAADILHTSTKTVHRLCQRGELGHVWVGKTVRLRRSEVEAYIVDNFVEAVSQ
jgi:excisionase family DNA binding protein